MSINVSNVNTQTQPQQVNTEAENKPKTKSKFWRGAQNVGAVAAAGAGYVGVKKVGTKIEQKMSSLFDNSVANSPNIISRNDAEKIFKSSGLCNKGVRIKDLAGATISEKESKEYLEAIEDLCSKDSKNKFKKFGKALSESIDAQKEMFHNDMILGKNACFNVSDKEVSINLDKLGVSLPHEMGHAKNFTGKGVGRVLSKMRGLSSLTIPILLVALFRKPKDKREESTTFVGKTLDFVKDNAVALTAACNAPIVLEEGLASIKGARMAKGILSPEKLKAMNKINFKAWGTYAVAAAIAVAGVWAVSKIKDKLCADDTPNEKDATKTDNVIKDNAKSDTRIEDTNLEAVA